MTAKLTYSTRKPKKIEFTPAPQDLRDKYREDYRKEDAATPYKLTYHPPHQAVVIRRFHDREFAMMAFDEVENTAILMDFSNGVSILGYKNMDVV